MIRVLIHALILLAEYGARRTRTTCEQRHEYKATFALYPTSMEDLLAIADAGEVMPKSTWFEPKLRSGLFVHSLK